MAGTTVKVSLLGEIKSFAGRREVMVSLAQGSRVEGLLHYLCESLGEAFARRLLDRDGSLYQHVNILINVSNINEFEGLQTRLVDGEVDVLVLPIWDGG